MGNHPIYRWANRGPERLFNWSTLIQLLNGAGYTWFVFPTAERCPISLLFKKLEGLVLASQDLLCLTLSGDCTQKLSWLCQVDSRCCNSPEDQESWRTNFRHLTWCPGRCLSDWSPHWALEGSGSEIEVQSPWGGIGPKVHPSQKTWRQYPCIKGEVWLNITERLN